MPNTIDLLKADHAHVKALFQQYDAAGTGRTRKSRALPKRYSPH